MPISSESAARLAQRGTAYAAWATSALFVLIAFGCGDTQPETLPDRYVPSQGDANDSTISGTGGAAASSSPPPPAGVHCAVSHAQPIGACVIADEGALYQDPVKGASLEMMGVVEAIAPGVMGCEGGLGDRRYSEQPYALVIRGEQYTVRVNLLLPYRAPLVDVGDIVSVKYLRKAVYYASADGTVELRAGDGNLLLWMGYSNSGFDPLTQPPEINFADGVPICTSPPGCESVTYRSIFVTTSDVTTELRYGEQADIGDYVAVHGHNRVGATQDGCVTESSGGELRMVAIRGTRATLAAHEEQLCSDGECIEDSDADAGP